MIFSISKYQIVTLTLVIYSNSIERPPPFLVIFIKYFFNLTKQLFHLLDALIVKYFQMFLFV